MSTYVMLTRVSGDALRDPASVEELGLRVTEKLHAVVRSFGHATTETWPATPWERFKELLRPAAAGGGRASVHQRATDNAA